MQRSSNYRDTVDRRKQPRKFHDPGRRALQAIHNDPADREDVNFCEFRMSHSREGIDNTNRGNKYTSARNGPTENKELRSLPLPVTRDP